MSANNQTKLIFVIDDSADSQALLTLLLESKGFTVLSALNGHEALTMLLELSHLPQVILLDAQMPVMDGYQFRIEQHNYDRIKDIPVIVMTGENDEFTNEKMIQPQGILTKPLQINSILESIAPFI